MSEPKDLRKWTIDEYGICSGPEFPDEETIEVTDLAAYKFAIQMRDNANARSKKLASVLKFIGDDLQIIGITPTELKYRSLIAEALAEYERETR